MDVEPEVQELSERIAAAQAAIEEEKATRARIEESQELEMEDEGERAFAALRDEVASARARLVELRGTKAAKRTPTAKPSRRGTGRGGLYFVAAMVGMPSLLVLLAMLVGWTRHPEQALETKIVLVFAAPLAVSIVMIVRVATRGTLDGDLI